MFKKLIKGLKEFHPSLRLKLILSLSAIAAILLLSSIISVREYDAMSTYVSGLIADDVNSINVAHKLSELSNTYNLALLAVIGDEGNFELPEFDAEYFLSHCDTLRSSLQLDIIGPLADSIVYSYCAYMLTSRELENVLYSDFIDSRAWYFNRLQPRFLRLQEDINRMDAAIYSNLRKNSLTFDRGFYRSIMPGIVAVGVGLLLVLMLLFFVIVYYVNPLYRMLDGLSNYRSYNKKYNINFEGDDQLGELNAGISELASENQQLRHRISALRDEMTKDR